MDITVEPEVIEREEGFQVPGDDNSRALDVAHDDATFVCSSSPPEITTAPLTHSHGSITSQSQDETGTTVRHRTLLRTRSRSRNAMIVEDEEFVILDNPENEIEANRIEQNYMFGFKKWKSHLTKRPLQERSSVVQELYKYPKEIKPVSYPTLTVCNVLYTLFVGWLMALVYCLVGLLMFLTVVAWKQGVFCFKLARYFFWPFGYFVQETEYRTDLVKTVSESCVEKVINPRPCPNGSHDDITLLSTEESGESLLTFQGVKTSSYWKRPSTYIWLVLAVPILFLLHALVLFVSWMLVVFLPVAKLNMIAIRRLLLLPPEKLKVSRTTVVKPGEQAREVIMCSYQAANFYSYKYTLDGMNIFYVNMLFFVIVAVVIGFADQGNRFTSATGRFVMGLLAIIPLAHYIGMAISSISAQSNHVVGAVLNATFGSIVEIILYISSLLKQQGQGRGEGAVCYSEIVKSALTGTLLVTMLFIPGICMMVGGLKHKEQTFNVRSMSVTSTLLFISVAGTFTPTIFTITLGGFECSQCLNSTNTSTLECIGCAYVYKLGDDSNFLYHRLRPLVYVCVSLLFLAYVIGLIFSLKTHTHLIQESSQHSGVATSNRHSKPEVHWGRIKSTIILLLAVVLMSLSAEVVVKNLDQVLATSTVIKPVFMGVSVLAVVPDLPEIINGIQFALKNNINLSLEIGCSVAVQVCLLQIPVLVLVDAIPELHFNLVFNDLHLWSVIISVIIINYIFVDEKSDYFQGCMLLIVYFILLAMFFFAGDSTKTDCSILQ
ncbi:uncharacterized protein [Diadema setosum]|uniref:uncharacterized protein n=1 Tax=Diadema setosum TaxID=31175 RepID=UPI003B3AEE9F